MNDEYVSSEKVKTDNLYKSTIVKKNSSYYLTKFKQFDQQEPDGLKASWNWSAFLFAGGWALYRRMYVEFFAFLGIALLSIMFLKKGFVGWSAFVLLFAQTIFAIFANSLYYTSTKKKS